jgi:hypothetical protein
MFYHFIKLVSFWEPRTYTATYATVTSSESAVNPVHVMSAYGHCKEV